MTESGAWRVRELGQVAYLPTLERMQAFTAERDAQTPDEVWLLEHPPLFTQGQAGKPEHLLNPGNIPVLQVDRGGQVTYHGPGQLVIYTLLDLKRLQMGPRDLVMLLEQSIIDVLAKYDVVGYGRRDAPGVYVKTSTGEAKIAALGLRIRRGCAYHGLALNLDVDLSAYDRINPCGYQGMAVTDLAAQTQHAWTRAEVVAHWLAFWQNHFSTRGAV
jgi:lipoyl(octanoyl) transferase